MQLRKEVANMKTFMTIMALAVLTIAFGTAYADEFPIAVTDEAGRVNYLGAFPGDAAIAATDFTSTHRSNEGVETGTALYKDSLMKDEMVARFEVKGSAAGGVSREDENSRIWDNLLKPTGLALE
jgi:hypothetical protein